MPQAAVVLIGWFAAALGPLKAPVHEVADNYFGREIRDPYRYMEEGTPEAMTASSTAGVDRTATRDSAGTPRRFAPGCKSLTSS